VSATLAHNKVKLRLLLSLQYDADMAAKAAEAANAGCVMRYVGRVNMAAGTASVSVQNYPASHPFAQLSGSENMIVFTTERYSGHAPLVVRGPGAGAQVTAAGVFGDLIAVLRYCTGART
jgi:aspartokinase/homoserine dehydrogenase 1